MALNKRKVLEIARKFAQKGAKAKALKEYNKLLKEDSRDAKLLLEVGDAYRRWGQNEEAIAQYGKVAQQYRQDGFDARAVAVFKQILNLDPKNYGAYVSLSELYQRMGLDSEAVSALQTAADGYHKEGRKTEALELLRQMAALDPTNTTSRLKVAELLKQEGMEREALSEYQAVVEELTNQQDRDQLITVLERILEVKPDQLNSLTALVRHLMAAGALDRAEPLAIRALDLSTEVPQYELLIDLYAQIGDESKLANVTRGLAKLYRDHGDEEKARELMQRLPVDEMGSGSRLAVDVSEVEEPVLDDEELLGDEEPFLMLGEDSEEPPTGSAGLELDLGGDPLDLGAGSDLSEPEMDAPEPVDSTPLPEGDPDQLLAEASVYLRYGKRDQAIASLRGVLAQEPDHRAALEKLGEAYVSNGENSKAVQVWMRAAELIRSAGDAGALAVIKDRIGALDPAMVKQIGPVADVPPSVEMLEFESEPPGIAMPILDLDVDLDLDLDNAIDDVAANATQAGLDFGSETDDFEIELDEDSVSLGSPSAAAAPDSASLVEVTEPDFGSSSSQAELEDDEEPLEFDFDPDGLSLDEPDSKVSVEDKSQSVDLTSQQAGSAAGRSASATAKISEELEEAEFYVAQEMYDEAEGILQRVLELVPGHPAALLRMGEVAAARKAGTDAVLGKSGGRSNRTHDNETTARLNEEDTFNAAVTDADATSFDHREDEEDAFEIDVDFDDEEDETDGVELDLSESDSSLVADDDTTATDTLSPDDEKRVEVAGKCATESGVAAQAVMTEQAVSEPMDAGSTFDLREALADVLAENDQPMTARHAVSGVLSTVEDGFESIFSDFKKGVTATLDVGDYDTRYDLGIAYREMGLYEDAIGEFRVCLDSPTRRFDSLYLMGLCARDLSRFADAINHLEQALAMPDLPESRMAGVYFDLSRAEEGAGNLERACGSLRRVLELDAAFPGAAARLASLEVGVVASPELGEPGETFESFDDLFRDEDDDDDDDGDAGLAAAVPTETFESFDDLVSEAEEALQDASFVEDRSAKGSSEAARAASAESPVEANGETQSPKKGGRKKISFV